MWIKDRSLSILISSSNLFQLRSISPSVSERLVVAIWDMVNQLQGCLPYFVRMQTTTTTNKQSETFGMLNGYLKELTGRYHKSRLWYIPHALLPDNLPNESIVFSRAILMLWNRTFPPTAIFSPTYRNASSGLHRLSSPSCTCFSFNFRYGIRTGEKKLRNAGKDYLEEEDQQDDGWRGPARSRAEAELDHMYFRFGEMLKRRHDFRNVHVLTSKQSDFAKRSGLTWEPVLEFNNNGLKVQLLRLIRAENRSRVRGSNALH